MAMPNSVPHNIVQGHVSRPVLAKARRHVTQWLAACPGNTVRLHQEQPCAPTPDPARALARAMTRWTGGESVLAA